MIESSSLQEENKIVKIKNVKNISRLKKENKVIKHRILEILEIFLSMKKNKIIINQ